jgi:hypothetical protein
MFRGQPELLIRARHKNCPGLSPLAAIKHSQIVVRSPSAAILSFPAKFDQVDIAILEWIAAESRRLRSNYRSDLMLQ